EQAKIAVSRIFDIGGSTYVLSYVASRSSNGNCDYVSFKPVQNYNSNTSPELRIATKFRKKGETALLRGDDLSIDGMLTALNHVFKLDFDVTKFVQGNELTTEYVTN